MEKRFLNCQKSPIFCGYWLQFYLKKMEVTFQESIPTTERFLLIKSNWQQLRRRTVIHKIMSGKHYLLAPTGKKKPKYKERQLLYISERGGFFVFTFKICKNFSLKEKFELTTTSIY